MPPLCRQTPRKVSKECKVLALDWQVIPRHLFVQPLIKIRIKGFITRFHWVVVWFNTAPISGGIQPIILTKVEEGLDHVQSTGFSFIISTSDYSRVTIGGAACKIPSCRLLWLPPCAGRHGYLLCLFDFIIAYVTATNFSRHQFPSSSLSDGLDKSRDGF